MMEMTKRTLVKKVFLHTCNWVGLQSSRTNCLPRRDPPNNGIGNRSEDGEDDEDVDEGEMEDEAQNTKSNRQVRRPIDHFVASRATLY